MKPNQGNGRSFAVGRKENGVDRYTKTVLTIIAASLSLIAAKMWEPREAHAGVFGSAPTIGDLRNAKDSEARARVINNVPLVRVFGSVSVD